MVSMFAGGAASAAGGGLASRVAFAVAAQATAADKLVSVLIFWDTDHKLRGDGPHMW